MILFNEEFFTDENASDTLVLLMENLVRFEKYP